MQAFQDHRLGLIDLRVLGAVWSFGSNPGDAVWPSRDAIGLRCGYSASRISNAISRLVDFGWLERTQVSRGPNQYVLLIPTVPSSGTVPESATVPSSGTSQCPNRAPHSAQFGHHIRTDQEETKNRPTDGVDARARTAGGEQVAGNTNPGSEGPHKGEGDEPPDSDAVHGIPNDWQPNERCWELVSNHGIDRRFAELELAAFKLYWSERKELRPWNSVFLDRVKATWKREKERQQGGTNITPLRPVPSGHRNGGGNFRTFEQMRAENTQRAIDEFLFGDNVGAVIDA